MDEPDTPLDIRVAPLGEYVIVPKGTKFRGAGKLGLNELPFGDTYIDHNCFVGKGLRFAHLNIRSLHYKLDHVNMFLHHNDTDVFCITETWLNDDFDDNDMHIDGYNVFRLDRIKDMEHGGILCYIKNGISCKQISDLDDDIVEAMWLELNLPQTKPILLGAVYRPPDSKAEYLSRIDSLFQECTNLYVALVQGVRPFSVKISGLVCVVSHLILLSTTTAKYSVIIWPSL